MYESLKEALRSDGTPFVEVTDADISAGRLLNADGTPRYPIVISLASEAIRNDEVVPLRSYVVAGGFLFVGLIVIHPQSGWNDPGRFHARHRVGAAYSERQSAELVSEHDV